MPGRYGYKDVSVLLQKGGVALKRYSNLKDAVINRGGKGCPVFAADAKAGVRYKFYISGASYNIVWEYLMNNVAPRAWNWYEIIVEDEPCNIHIDFEFYTATNPHLTEELHTFYLVEMCLFLVESFSTLFNDEEEQKLLQKTELLSIFDTKLEDNCPYTLMSNHPEDADQNILDLSQWLVDCGCDKKIVDMITICSVRSRTQKGPKEKISFHDLIYIKGFCFRNNYHVGAFMRDFEVYILKKYGDVDVNPFFTRKQKKNDARTYINHKPMPSFNKSSCRFEYTDQQLKEIESKGSLEDYKGGDWDNPVDQAIYTDGRNYRLPYNTKAEDYRPIVPLKKYNEFETAVESLRERCKTKKSTLLNPDKMEYELWRDKKQRNYSCFRLGSACFVSPGSYILSCYEPDGVTPPESITASSKFWYLFDPVKYPRDNSYFVNAVKRREKNKRKAAGDDNALKKKKSNLTMRKIEPRIAEEDQAILLTKFDNIDDTNDIKNKDFDRDDNEDDEEEVGSEDESLDEGIHSAIGVMYKTLKWLLPYYLMAAGWPLWKQRRKPFRWDKAKFQTKYGSPHFDVESWSTDCALYYAANPSMVPKPKVDKVDKEEPTKTGPAGRLYHHQTNRAVFKIYIRYNCIVQTCFDGDCKKDKNNRRFPSASSRAKSHTAAGRVPILPPSEVRVDHVDKTTRKWLTKKETLKTMKMHFLRYKEALQKYNRLQSAKRRVQAKVEPISIEEIAQKQLQDSAKHDVPSFMKGKTVPSSAVITEQEGCASEDGDEDLFIEEGQNYSSVRSDHVVPSFFLSKRQTDEDPASSSCSSSSLTTSNERARLPRYHSDNNLPFEVSKILFLEDVLGIKEEEDDNNVRQGVLFSKKKKKKNPVRKLPNRLTQSDSAVCFISTKKKKSIPKSVKVYGAIPENAAQAAWKQKLLQNNKKRNAYRRRRQSLFKTRK